MAPNHTRIQKDSAFTRETEQERGKKRRRLRGKRERERERDKVRSVAKQKTLSAGLRDAGN